MVYKVTKKLADKYMKISGDTSGISMQPDTEWVLEKYGENGLIKIEKRMKQLNYPIDFRNIDSGKKYNQGYQILMVLLMRELFGMTKNECFKMGQNNLKVSFLIKTIIRAFVSEKDALEEGVKIWHRNSSKGKLSFTKIDMKNKKIVMKLEDYPVHPFFMIFMLGFFKSFADLAIGKQTNIKQTKFESKGDKYNELVYTWD